jgi:hypothetical protein
VHAVEVNGTYRFPRRQFAIGWPTPLAPGADMAVDAAEKDDTGRESRALFSDMGQTALIARGRQPPAERLRGGGKVRRITSIIDNVGLS